MQPQEQQSNVKNFAMPLIVVIVFAGIIFLGTRSSNPPATIKTADELELVEWPSEQVRKETITSNSEGYEITGFYPVTKSDSITAIFKNFINDQIISFKTDTSVEGGLPEGYRAMTLDITYEENKNVNADNYIFLSYSETGGAHGLAVTKTFSFTKTGQQIKLADLFTNDERGLGIIADVVNKELMKRDFADQKWINEGASPVAENYQNFIIEEAGVTFIFDQYQVAPYAAGIQRVTVPITAFRSIANPEIFTNK